jgi:hypothetical protein
MEHRRSPTRNLEDATLNDIDVLGQHGQSCSPIGPLGQDRLAVWGDARLRIGVYFEAPRYACHIHIVATHDRVVSSRSRNFRRFSILLLYEIIHEAEYRHGCYGTGGRGIGRLLLFRQSGSSKIQ